MCVGGNLSQAIVAHQLPKSLVGVGRAQVALLQQLQQQLTRAEKDAKAAVAAQRSARARHREAQSARNRAARRAEA